MEVPLGAAPPQRAVQGAQPQAGPEGAALQLPLVVHGVQPQVGPEEAEPPVPQAVQGAAARLALEVPVGSTTGELRG